MKTRASQGWEPRINCIGGHRPDPPVPHWPSFAQFIEKPFGENSLQWFLQPTFSGKWHLDTCVYPTSNQAMAMWSRTHKGRRKKSLSPFNTNGGFDAARECYSWGGFTHHSFLDFSSFRLPIPNLFLCNTALRKSCLKQSKSNLI